MQNIRSHIIRVLIEFFGTDNQRIEHALRVLYHAGKIMEDNESCDSEIVIASALLHDVGKIYLHHELLNKPGDLTCDEFDIIKRHTINGGRIIGKNPTV